MLLIFYFNGIEINKPLLASYALSGSLHLDKTYSILLIFYKLQTLIGYYINQNYFQQFQYLNRYWNGVETIWKYCIRWILNSHITI